MAAAQDPLLALVRDAGEPLALVRDGQCIAASRDARALFGKPTGSINVLLENVVPTQAQPKLKAAWTRAGKRPVSSATFEPDTNGGQTSIHFYNLDDGTTLLRLVADIEQPSSDDVVGATAEPAPDATDLARQSHPGLPQGYGRTDFLAEVEQLETGSSAQSPNFAIIAVTIGGQADWQSLEACKAVLVRLNEVVRGHDSIFHIHGPHFWVLQRHIRSSEDTLKLCTRLAEILSEPFLEESLPLQAEIAIQWQLGGKTMTCQSDLDKCLDDGLAEQFAHVEDLDNQALKLTVA